MRSTKPYLASVLVATFASSSAAEKSKIAEIDMKLLKPAFAFQLCVRINTDSFLVELPAEGRPVIDDLIHEAWKHVVKACHSHLDSDESKGTIFLGYEGNTNKSWGFVDGVYYAGHAYVISRCIDLETPPSRQSPHNQNPLRQ